MSYLSVDGETTPALPGRGLYRVAGIDISLTGTGVATHHGTVRITSTGHRRDSITQRHARMQSITGHVLREVGDVHLACIEGPVCYATPGGSTWDRGGLWWRIVAALLDRDIPVAVISPTARAKYATGSGAARKTAVLEAAQRRYGALLESDDEADALILRAMGLDWLGQPLAEVPAGHRAALAGVQWPDREAVGLTVPGGRHDEPVLTPRPCPATEEVA